MEKINLYLFSLPFFQKKKKYIFSHVHHRILASAAMANLQKTTKEALQTNDWEPYASRGIASNVRLNSYHQLSTPSWLFLIRLDDSESVFLRGGIHAIQTACQRLINHY